MANQQSLSGLSKFGDLKKRLAFLLGALVVFRIGAHIPVPGVDAVALAKLYEGAANGIFGMLNMFSGGSLERFSILQLVSCLIFRHRLLFSLLLRLFLL